MNALGRRIAKLEIRSPAEPMPSNMIPLKDLDPKVAAMFVARNRDVTTMAMDELDALEAELLRFTE